MTYAYDEATLDLLRLTIPTYGILVPIIQRSGTNEIIDGRHRLKIRDEMAEQGIKIMLPVHHVDTDNPAEIDQIVNSVRRPWQDTEQRRKLVAQLREKGHSHQHIADAVGTAKSTVQEDLKVKPAGGRNRPPAAQPATCSKGKDGKSYSPPATEAEKVKAWEMKDSGMGASAIAKDLGRGERTVRDWFKKERPEAVAIGQPVMPAPKPKPEEPLTPTGQISKETEDIVSKEKKCLQQKIEQVKQLDELNEQFTVYWRHLQKNWTKQGRSVVKMHREVAEKIFLRDGTMQPWQKRLDYPKQHLSKIAYGVCKQGLRSLNLQFVLHFVSITT
jgi:predicted transcriptional regulator